MWVMSLEYHHHPRHNHLSLSLWNVLWSFSCTCGSVLKTGNCGLKTLRTRNDKNLTSSPIISTISLISLVPKENLTVAWPEQIKSRQVGGSSKLNLTESLLCDGRIQFNWTVLWSDPRLNPGSYLISWSSSLWMMINIYHVHHHWSHFRSVLEHVAHIMHMWRNDIMTKRHNDNWQAQQLPASVASLSSSRCQGL